MTSRFPVDISSYPFKMGMSVWDDIADDREEAEDLRLRAALLRDVRGHFDGMDLIEVAEVLELAEFRAGDLLAGKVSEFSLDALVDIASKVRPADRIVALASDHPVMSRPMATDWTARLSKTGDELADARAKEKATLEKARHLAIEAAADGKTESSIAHLLGVDRMTVRKWLGKGPKPGDHPSLGKPSRPQS